MQLRLIGLYETVRPRLQELGLKMTKLAYNRKKIDSASERELQNCITWLEAFIDVRIKELDRAIGLVPAEMWERYKAMGAEGLREQRIREQAEKDMLNDWRCRPDLLRRNLDEPHGKGKNKRTAPGHHKSKKRNRHHKSETGQADSDISSNGAVL